MYLHRNIILTHLENSLLQIAVTTDIRHPAVACHYCARPMVFPASECDCPWLVPIYAAWWSEVHVSAWCVTLLHNGGIAWDRTEPVIHAGVLLQSNIIYYASRLLYEYLITENTEISH